LVALVLGFMFEIAATTIYFWGQLRNVDMIANPVTWFGLAAVMSVGTWSSFSAGGGLGAYILLLMTAGTWLIFLTTAYYWIFRRQRVYPPTKVDILLGVFGALLLGARAVGLPPLPSAIVAVVGDVCFIWPTLRKVWEHPDSEGWHGKWGWTLTTVATIFAFCALDSYSPTAALYPLYVVLSTGLLAGACWGWTPGKSFYYRLVGWRQAHIKARVSRV
jgi:hypothetical protein